MGRGGNTDKGRISEASLVARHASTVTSPPAFWEEQWDEKYAPLFEMQAHDLDPRDDYEIRVDQLSHPLLQEAERHIARILSGEDAFFERAHVYPAREGMGQSVGMYCVGTYVEPVILIDIDAHSGYEEQIIITVEHELRHAMQEWEDPDTDFDEDDAESFRFRLGPLEARK